MCANQSNTGASVVPEQQPLALNDICLDFQFKATSFRPQFTQFLERTRSELGLEGGEDIAQAYIERVWPADLPGSFIATYASCDGFDRLIIRPPVQGPNAASFGVNGLVPAFGIYRRQAVFVVDSFVLVPHIPPRPFERYVSGQMHTQSNGKYMSQEDLAALVSLPRQRMQTSKELDNWIECLDWQQKLVLIGQETFRYEGYQVGDDDLIRFLVRANGSLGRLVYKGGTVMLATVLTSSLSPERWEPQAGSRPNLIRLGRVVKAQHLGKNNKFFERSDRADQTEDKTSLAVITLETDSGSDGPLDLQVNVIPQEGFLLASVGGDIKPISSARRAINRLRKGFGHNAYLADYIFNIANAAVPEEIADTLPGGRLFSSVNFNAEQQKAVIKALAADDIALIQGPPGTGKTTVIVAICWGEIQAGKRVLVVSQANTAVDNVLARLGSDPAMRPLRIGNARRIEPESHIFLADNALVPWFKVISHSCIQKTNSNSEIVGKIKDAEEAFSGLSSMLVNFEKTTEQIAEQASRKKGLNSQKQDLIAQQKQALTSAEGVKRQQATMNDLAVWAANPQGTLPSLELLSDTSLIAPAKKAVEDIREILQAVLGQINQPESSDPQQAQKSRSKVGNDGSWKKLLTRIKTTAKGLFGTTSDLWQLSWLGIADSQDSPNYWSMLEATQKAITAAEGFTNLLSDALALCGDASLQANSPQAAQLRKLLGQKAALVNSDNDADLLKVAQINRQIRSLQSDHWGKICRGIHNYCLALFQNNLPHDLDLLTASLQPDGKWTDTLENLRILCESITGPCREVLAGSLAAIIRQAESGAEDNKARIEQAQSRIESIRADIDEIDYEISEVDYQLVDFQALFAEYQQRWAQLWPTVCPDLEEIPEESPQIARKILDERRRGFEDWFSDGSAQRERQDKWDSIRLEWTAKLDDPKTAEDKGFKSDYTAHANMVGLTCLETGQRSFYDSSYFEPFDTVIIDEVSKATPAELLMPMMCGRKVVLVGDHRQLPPMVRERESSFTEALEEGQIKREDFERFEKLITSSFFEKLFEAAPDSIRQSLFAQYRMHPQIMAAVNQFYDGRLTAAGGPEHLDNLRQHQLAIKDRLGGWFLEPHQHILWIDSTRDPKGRIATEQQVGSSKVNPLEIELVAVSLMRLNHGLKEKGYCAEKKAQAKSAQKGITLGAWAKRLMPGATERTIADIFSRGQVKINGHRTGSDYIVKTGDTLELDGRLPVGVITFYGAQLGQLRRKIAYILAHHPKFLDALNIRTNTVDKFQGMEMPIVIVSLVRASYHRQISQFVKEYRRINVALSRAQTLLIIVGSERTFRDVTVDLPNMNDGTIKQIPAYKNIYDIVTQFGGRRYARQILKW